MGTKNMTSILFVCTGNICRSPTAEGVLRHLAAQAKFPLRVDSAGTHSYHTGQPPDPRSQSAALSRGFDLSEQRARQVTEDDFHSFDWILAMDRDHIEILESMRPAGSTARLRLFLEFAADLQSGTRDVPDPYYGGAKGFERVLDLVEQASKGLLEHLRSP